MKKSFEYLRRFTAEILEASIFGAFMLAIQTRKQENNLTQAELAERTGKEKTGISKLLAGPRNWEIKTIAALAEALHLRFEFALVDKLKPYRRFTATGIQYTAPVPIPATPIAEAKDWIGENKMPSISPAQQFGQFEPAQVRAIPIPQFVAS